MALTYQRLKLVVEPSGVLGLAALLSGVVSGYRRVGVIFSGGNVDIDVFCQQISGALAEQNS